jgi:hypothetical protein
VPASPAGFLFTTATGDANARHLPEFANGGPMPEVLIRCPQTGKDVVTGLMLDDQAFQNANLRDQEAFCPHCGRQHHWDQTDAYLRSPPGERPTH